MCLEFRIFKQSIRRNKVKRMTCFENIYLSTNNVKDMMLSVKMKTGIILITSETFQTYLQQRDIESYHERDDKVMLDLGPPFRLTFIFRFSSLEKKQQFLHIIQVLR